MMDNFPDQPYWIIDILPEQVPEDRAGRFFAVERYYLQPSRLDDVHRRFTDLLLKLNCYSDFRVCFSGTDQEFVNPAPDLLAAWIIAERKDLCIFLEKENAMITLNHDDLYMTVYNPSGEILNRIRRLASAGGFFLRQPGKAAEAD